ncbi:MAG: alpha/beta hydrolase [Ornithinibacter sp.]
MARLPGRTLYAIELPGFGLTDPTAYHPDTIRRSAVDYLGGVVDALGLGSSEFVTQSMDSQWTTWLAAEQLRRIHHLVRLIWGEDDAFGRPDAGRRMAELLPDADFHVVPGGHAPWFHQADTVAGLTREFLEDQP